MSEDRILLRGLRVRGHHGVLPHEAQLGQLFEVDLELALDLAAAGRADDLDLTVDYGSLAGRVAEVVGGRPGSCWRRWPRTWPSWSWPISGSARSGSG